MWWESLAALLALPLEAVELAAHGGTNFSKLELLRSNAHSQEVYGSIAQIGHTVEQMISWINQLRLEGGHPMRCRQIIISGGIKDFLDGYYWMEKLNLPFGLSVLSVSWFYNLIVNGMWKNSEYTMNIVFFLFIFFNYFLQ